MDTCYSGTFDRTIAMRGSVEDLSKRRLTEGDIKRILTYPTRRYLTSGGKEQVPDVSPFAQALLEALRSKGGVDNILTIDEILSYMKNLINPNHAQADLVAMNVEANFCFLHNETIKDTKRT